MEMMVETGFWGMLANATLVVKLVLLLLVSMSVVSWTIIFYKAMNLKRASKQALKDMESFEDAESLTMGMALLRKEDRSRCHAIGIEGMRELKRLEGTRQSPSLKLKTGMDTLHRALRQGVNREANDLSAGLPFLATCGNAAPFIGLFGTVWGIMNAFHSIGIEQSAALATVAPGISEALVATAIGLAVAIPASIAYNFFQGVMGRIESEFDAFAGIFLNRVQREMPMITAEDTTRERRT